MLVFRCVAHDALFVCVRVFCHVRLFVCHFVLFFVAFFQFLFSFFFFRFSGYSFFVATGGNDEVFSVPTPDVQERARGWDGRRGGREGGREGRRGGAGGGVGQNWSGWHNECLQRPPRRTLVFALYLPTFPHTHTPEKKPSDPMRRPQNYS